MGGGIREKEEAQEDDYNLEARFLGKVLDNYQEEVIPLKSIAQLEPTEMNLGAYWVALDNVVAFLEVSARISRKSLRNLHKKQDTALTDALRGEKGRPSANPLRALNYEISRLVARASFYTKPSFDDDEEEGPEEHPD